MKKNEEKKFKEMIKTIIGESYKESDMILIQELVDWISIAVKAKSDLQKEVKKDGVMGWQNLTTISMCSKAIINCFKSLGISPAERSRSKSEKEGQKFDLQKFLNEN